MTRTWTLHPRPMRWIWIEFWAFIVFCIERRRKRPYRLALPEENIKSLVEHAIQLCPDSPAFLNYFQIDIWSGLRAETNGFVYNETLFLFSTLLVANPYNKIERENQGPFLHKFFFSPQVGMKFSKPLPLRVSLMILVFYDSISICMQWSRAPSLNLLYDSLDGR